MSEITFYAKKKLNDYMALVLETHVQPNHLDCIEMRIYIDKQKCYNNDPTSIGEMLDYIRTAILNFNAFMNDFYDAIFVYQQTKKLNADKAADLFINIIKTADDTFTSLQFDKDYDMIEIFTKVNNNIESEYYTTGIIKR